MPQASSQQPKAALRPNALNDPALRTNIAGVQLATPIILAAGTAGTLDELASVIDLSRVGALVTKSITPQSREGNAPWRIIESRVGAGGAGMLNAIGLANPGIDNFERDYLPRAAKLPCAVIASVAGFSTDDYAHVASRLALWIGRGIDAIELNVSCPNVKSGVEFGSSPDLVAQVLAAVRSTIDDTAAASTQHRHVPIFVKLSPAFGSDRLIEIAAAAQTSGADAITLGNTMPAMEIDVETRRPVLANTTGGLSGPALRPIVSKLIYDTARKLPNLPIIGAGGVTTWRDAAEFILAGATAMQVGTLTFADLRAPAKLADQLRSWTRRQNANNPADLRGRIESAPTP